jgi:hypothetical protein
LAPDACAGALVQGSYGMAANASAFSGAAANLTRLARCRLSASTRSGRPANSGRESARRGCAMAKEQWCFSVFLPAHWQALERARVLCMSSSSERRFWRASSLRSVPRQRCLAACVKHRAHSPNTGGTRVDACRRCRACADSCAVVCDAVVQICPANDWVRV